MQGYAKASKCSELMYTMDSKADLSKGMLAGISVSSLSIG